jgi:hypothetical protein
MAITFLGWHAAMQLCNARPTLLLRKLSMRAVACALQSKAAFVCGVRVYWPRQHALFNLPRGLRNVHSPWLHHCSCTHAYHNKSAPEHQASVQCVCCLRPCWTHDATRAPSLSLVQTLVAFSYIKACSIWAPPLFPG